MTRSLVHLPMSFISSSVSPGSTSSQFCSYLALEDMPPAAQIVGALARTRQSRPTGHARPEDVFPALAALLPHAGPAVVSLALHGS